MVGVHVPNESFKKTINDMMKEEVLKLAGSTSPQRKKGEITNALLTLNPDFNSLSEENAIAKKVVAF